MKFQPKTEKEIQDEKLLAEDWYDATVIKAEEKRSSSGNDMIEVTLRLYRSDGHTIQLRDWLLEAMLEKMLRFCAAAGLSAQYEAGELQAEDIVGADVKALVKIQQDKTGKYGAQNKITDYQARGAAKQLVGASAGAASPIASDSQIDEADIPF